MSLSRRNRACRAVVTALGRSCCGGRDELLPLLEFTRCARTHAKGFKVEEMTTTTPGDAVGLSHTERTEECEAWTIGEDDRGQADRGQAAGSACLVNGLCSLTRNSTVEEAASVCTGEGRPREPLRLGLADEGRLPPSLRLSSSVATPYVSDRLGSHSLRCRALLLGIGFGRNLHELYVAQGQCTRT